MKKMLMLAMAMLMVLSVPFGAMAAGEETTAEMMTIRVPVPADWAIQKQEQAGMLMLMCMPEDGSKEAIMLMGMDLQDESTAAMTMYIYKMMLGEEETFKQLILQMTGAADSPESQEAMAVLESMKVSAAEIALDGREAIRIDFSMDVKGEPGAGTLVITVDGQYNYVLMYLASPEDGIVSDYFDSVLERTAFVPAEQAAA